MNERTFEIIVRSNLPRIFGAGWRLIAQQLTLSSGRLDLLVADNDDGKHLIELKKGTAHPEAALQAHRYACELRCLLRHQSVTAWVLAHKISDPLRSASISLGVKCMAVSLERCAELIRASGLTTSDLFGVRREAGVLHGGSGKPGVWEKLNLSMVVADLDVPTTGVVSRIISRAGFAITCGRMQMVIHYLGVKIGGINRGHRHFYIAEGAILNQEHETELRSLGFAQRSKSQAGGHQHIWWQISLSRASEFEQALELSIQTVNRSLGIT